MSETNILEIPQAPPPTRYDEETLKSYIWDYQLKVEEISNLYGNNPNGLPRISIDRILVDIKRWKIRPTFIEGYDIVNQIRAAIQEYDLTIAKYSKDNQAGYRKINLILTYFEKVKDLLLKKDSSDEIKELISNMFQMDVNIKDIIKFQQTDETIRIEYYKLRQNEVKLLMKGVEVQEQAINTEAMLVSAFEELAKIDALHNTNYSYNFQQNIKARILKKLSTEVILNTPLIQKNIRILRKEEKRKNYKASEKQQIYMSKIKVIAEEYKINMPQAQMVYKEYTDSFKNGEATKKISNIIKIYKEAFELFYSGRIDQKEK
jgi:hypothetical protein